MTTPRDDMNDLCRTAADLALELLEKHGEFVPFGVVSNRDDELRMITLGEDELNEDGEKDVALIRELLIDLAEKGEFNASAVVSNVRVRLEDFGEETDAVRIELEHAQDQPITVILPYRIENEAIEQHIDPYMEPGERIVFG